MPSTSTRETRVDPVGVQIKLEAEMVHKLRIRAALDNLTLQGGIREAIRRYLDDQSPLQSAAS